MSTFPNQAVAAWTQSHTQTSMTLLGRIITSQFFFSMHLSQMRWSSVIDDASRTVVFSELKDGSYFFGISFDLEGTGGWSSSLPTTQRDLTDPAPSDPVPSDLTTTEGTETVVRTPIEGSTPNSGNVGLRTGFILTGDDLRLSETGDTVEGGLHAIQFVEFWKPLERFQGTAESFPQREGYVTFDEIQPLASGQLPTLLDLFGPVTRDMTFGTSTARQIEFALQQQTAGFREQFGAGSNSITAGVENGRTPNVHGGRGQDVIELIDGGTARGGADGDFMSAGGYWIKEARHGRSNLPIDLHLGRDVVGSITVEGAMLDEDAPLPETPLAPFDLHGNAGNDMMLYSGGISRLRGGSGRDVLLGIDNGGPDEMETRLSGGQGNDTIYATGDHARINGGKGRDEIWVMAQDAIVTGGPGADVFIFSAGKSGQARIRDFDLRRDHIEIADADADTILRHHQSGDDLVLTIDGYVVTLDNITLDSFREANPIG